jgi:predicted nucleotidyltransferase
MQFSYRYSVIMLETLSIQDKETAGEVAAVIRAALERNGIGLERLVLFGSRCAGTSRPDSDWDFLGVIDRKLSFNSRADLALEVKRSCAVAHVSVDLILVADSDFERRVMDTGTIVHYAVKDCISV